MILGRKYIPSNRSIEVSKDPNLHFSKKTRIYTMTKKDKSDQGEFGFNKPKVGEAELPDTPPIQSLQGYAADDQKMPMKGDTMPDTPPTPEDFETLQQLSVARYGEKVRISGYELDEPMTKRILERKIRIPKRDTNDNIIRDPITGEIETEEVSFGSLWGTSSDAVLKLLLNSLNNVGQGVTPATFISLRATFRKAYDIADDAEKLETERNLIAMDTTGFLTNSDNLPYLVPNFYMNNLRDIMYGVKYRIFMFRRGSGATLRQISTDFNRAGLTFLGTNYDPFPSANPINLLRLSLNVIANALPIKTLEELDYIYMENLLSSITNSEIDWATVNAQGIAGHGSRNPMYLLAWQMMLGIDIAAALTTYREWYEARSLIYLNMFTNIATNAERLAVVNMASAKSLANGCDLTQQVARQVVGGGIGGMVPAFAGGAVYTVPNVPVPRQPIRV